VIFFNKKVLT